MSNKTAVDNFMAQKKIAFVGLSRKGNQFSNMAHKALKKGGYEIIPVNPSAEAIGGEKCYPDLNSIEGKVDAALVMTPSAEAAEIVESAAECGIKHVWIQQGAESEDAEAIGAEKGIELVTGECIMMFAEPTALMHRVHRWVWGKLGKLPK
ncbi:MAG: CoA-binding protein [Spirochaetales bacterium]|nr:CoA-binding protein [Spirochaetales bacterium]